MLYTKIIMIDGNFLEPQKILEKFGISDGMQVADLGSGPGFYVLAAANLVGADGKIYAVDVQKDVLQKLNEEARREGVLNIETVWGDFEEKGGSRLPDNHFDVVIISNTLFQVEDKKGVALEAYRILKKNGRLLVVDWTESFGGLGPQPEHIFSESEAKNLFIGHQFDFLNTLEAGAHHYGLAFRKR